MNVADFFIGVGTGILVPIIAVCFIYLSVKRIITKDPKVAVRFAMKHMGGPGNVTATRPATAEFPTFTTGFFSSSTESKDRPTTTNSASSEPGSGVFGGSL